MTNYEKYKDDPQAAFREQVAYCKRHSENKTHAFRCDCPMSTGKVPCIMNWLYAEYESCNNCIYYIGFSHLTDRGMCLKHGVMVKADDSPCFNHEENKHECKEVINDE